SSTGPNAFAATPRQLVTNLISDSIKKVSSSSLSEKDVKVTSSSIPSIDYQSNSAFLLAKQLKRSPIQLAEEIVKNLTQASFVESSFSSTPGFVNISLTTKWLSERLL